ncbi:MAG TPA: PIN domain-containing protein, partial [Thermoanaerobaculia bacterium]|nr:PIN domain-containing protein [Thermoanaerobaculia bacterium]
MVAASSGYLLDTNVISELMKARPARSVAEWIVATPEDLLHLSVITIGEIRKGIDLLEEDDPKRAALQSWLDRDLRVRFAGRLLPFDEWVAERWGQ